MLNYFIQNLRLTSAAAVMSCLIAALLPALTALTKAVLPLLSMASTSRGLKSKIKTLLTEPQALFLSYRLLSYYCQNTDCINSQKNTVIPAERQPDLMDRLVKIINLYYQCTKFHMDSTRKKMLCFM